MTSEVAFCDWCQGLSPWRPIETVPMKERVLLGSYYDSFRLRPPFVPIWQMTEGHAFEWNGAVEFSLRGTLQRAPTHWMPIPTPPNYAPSPEQNAIASADRSAEGGETRSEAKGLDPEDESAVGAEGDETPNPSCPPPISHPGTPIP